MRAVVGKGCKRVAGCEAEVGKQRGPVRDLSARFVWVEKVGIMSAYITKRQLSVSELDVGCGDVDAKDEQVADGSCLKLLTTVLGCLTLQKSG